MPSYEGTVLLRKLAKPETVSALKRITSKILEHNGIVYGIESLGLRTLPFKITNHAVKHTEGCHYILKFDSSTVKLPEIRDEWRRDVDIIRAGIIRNKPESAYECTLDEESKPPAFREDVQKLIEEGRKREIIYDMRTGLNYNPFKR